MDPVKMAQAANALAGRLASLDPAHAAEYAARAEAFDRLANARVADWKRKAAGSPGVVFFHKDGNYLARLLNVPILGFVEPLPGIPPTAGHLRGLVQRLRGKPGAVLYADFQPSQGPDFLARELGWGKAQLPLEPALDANGAGYLDLIGRWVDAIAAAKP
jgi:zinc/manganese transport system substrate-binding protein